MNLEAKAFLVALGLFLLAVLYRLATTPPPSCGCRDCRLARASERFHDELLERVRASSRAAPPTWFGNRESDGEPYYPERVTFVDPELERLEAERVAPRIDARPAIPPPPLVARAQVVEDDET